MSKPIKQISTRAHSSSAQPHEVDAFIRRIGKNVLRARQSKGLSRRVLSENSGVSPRTIVLLETGEGNISIALLFRIAQALGHSVERFLGPTNAAEDDAQRVADFYNAATPRDQQRVLNLLASNQANTLKQRRICLIGLRGAGKSTLGHKLGNALSFPFIELNKEVEKRSGLSIQEVMNLYGQDGYRQFEQQALETCVDSNDQMVLAVAGGVVTDSASHTFLLRHFHTVWLKATPEEHMSRVKRQGDSRPMAGNPEAMTQLRAILAAREPLYALSDVIVDTSKQSIDATLKKLQLSVGRILHPEKPEIASID